MKILSNEEQVRYARQIVLPGVGEEGQKKLSASSVLVVGCGGLGSPVALYLAAAGVGRIGLLDLDRVELSNLQRQILHDTMSLGESKPASGARRIKALNSHVDVRIHEGMLTLENAADLFAPYDMIVDASDNYETRLLGNEIACRQKKPFVMGAVSQFFGQVGVFFPSKRGGCYRCMIPEIPHVDEALTPARLGVMGAAAGVVGSMQAMEAIKLILGLGHSLIGEMFHIDLLTMKSRKVSLPQDPCCPACRKLQV